MSGSFAWSKGRKVSRAPSLEGYDSTPPAPISTAAHDKVYASTRERDRAALLALGVNGAVPLWAACLHSGLMKVASLDVQKYLEMVAAIERASNDNRAERRAAA